MSAAFRLAWRRAAAAGLILVLASPAALGAAQESVADGGAAAPWWIWPPILFVFCFVLGVVAVLAGVGGGVLYVPLVGGFFPFHIDFVRGAGLMVALAGALAAGPGLLRRNLASLRLAMPVALVASTCAIFGAMLGLYLSALDPLLVQACLGFTITGIGVLLLLSKNTEKPVVSKQDAMSLAFGLSGAYFDVGMRERVEWKTHRTLLGLALFIVIGVLAGMFGLGAGWANVPVLNLVMGAPIKVSVATSKFLLSITDTSAAWIYMNRGCVIPLIAVPSIVGLMLGSLVGVRLLSVVKPRLIRRMVILVLFFAGLRAIDRGLSLGLLG
ncbi:MAG: sulfite exporter TauE/SafE family protein [Planctomycetes bacterium]|nr:sulfite exporter TauE/SafE family protein [Planctomycetota bacterium]